jgi:TetR/AcrR family transcriptional repressor of nem operon
MMDEAKSSNPSGKAMAILSLMVGAVTLSRLIEEENLSQGILDAAASEVRRIASDEGGA